jgi:hypothetical protein
MYLEDRLAGFAIVDAVLDGDTDSAVSTESVNNS